MAPKFRGRLQLLYDEYGTLKCETCFQCAQACPIECIDMGGVDTKGRFHVHWGPPETYGERREESALRRSGRPVPDPAYTRFEPLDIGRRWTRSSSATTTTPRRCSRILEETQAEYGYLPVARAQAHLPDDRGLVRHDLRHRHVLPAPAASSRPTVASAAARRATAHAADRGGLSRPRSTTSLGRTAGSGGRSH